MEKSSNPNLCVKIELNACYPTSIFHDFDSLQIISPQSCIIMTVECHLILRPNGLWQNLENFELYCMGSVTAKARITRDTTWVDSEYGEASYSVALNLEHFFPHTMFNQCTIKYMCKFYYQTTLKFCL